MGEVDQYRQRYEELSSNENIEGLLNLRRELVVLENDVSGSEEEQAAFASLKMDVNATVVRMQEEAGQLLDTTSTGVVVNQLQNLENAVDNNEEVVEETESPDGNDTSATDSTDVVSEEGETGEDSDGEQSESEEERRYNDIWGSTVAAVTGAATAVGNFGKKVGTNAWGAVTDLPGTIKGVGDGFRGLRDKVMQAPWLEQMRAAVYQPGSGRNEFLDWLPGGEYVKRMLGGSEKFLERYGEKLGRTMGVKLRETWGQSIPEMEWDASVGEFVIVKDERDEPRMSNTNTLQIVLPPVEGQSAVTLAGVTDTNVFKGDAGKLYQAGYAPKQPLDSSSLALWVYNIFGDPHDNGADGSWMGQGISLLHKQGYQLVDADGKINLYLLGRYLAILSEFEDEGHIGTIEGSDQSNFVLEWGHIQPFFEDNTYEDDRSNIEASWRPPSFGHNAAVVGVGGSSTTNSTDTTTQSLNTTTTTSASASTSLSNPTASHPTAVVSTPHASTSAATQGRRSLPEFGAGEGARGVVPTGPVVLTNPYVIHYEPATEFEDNSGEGGGLAVQNNNPGNIKDMGFGHPIGQDENEFARFNSPRDGFVALVEKIIYNQTNPGSTYYGTTIQGYVNIYAPALDNNNPEQYASNVAELLGDGIAVDTPIEDLDPVLFAAALAQNEDGVMRDILADRGIIEEVRSLVVQSRVHQSASSAFERTGYGMSVERLIALLGNGGRSVDASDWPEITERQTGTTELSGAPKQCTRGAAYMIGATRDLKPAITGHGGAWIRNNPAYFSLRGRGEMVEFGDVMVTGEGSDASYGHVGFCLGSNPDDPTHVWMISMNKGGSGPNPNGLFKVTYERIDDYSFGEVTSQAFRETFVTKVVELTSRAEDLY